MTGRGSELQMPGVVDLERMVALNRGAMRLEWAGRIRGGPERIRRIFVGSGWMVGYLR